MPTAPKPNAKKQAALDEQLIAAAWKNDVRRARALIDQGADVNAKDNTVQSAYLISTSEGYLELLNLTLGHGADVDSKDSFNGTGLIRAADRGHADIAGRLIQADIKINHINNLGWTALHEAIILGNGSRRYVDTVLVLVAGGADLRLPSQRDQISRSTTPRPRGTTRSPRCSRLLSTLTSHRSRWPTDGYSLRHSVVTRQPRRSLFARVRTWKPATREAVRRSCSP